MKWCVLGKTGFIGSHWSLADFPLEQADAVLNLRYTTSRDELRQLAVSLHGKFVIHVSSMAVYEPFPRGPAHEDDPLEPPLDDVYACSKLAAERILQPAVILRPSIVTGPGGFWSDVKAPRRASGRIQPIAVEDFLAVVRRAVDFAPGVYNVPGPQVVTWAELCRGGSRALPGYDFTRDRLLATRR